MANNLKTSTVARNAALDGIAALANSGLVRIYDGSQPATPQTAISGQVLLVTLTLNATAFPAASSGTLTANAITSGTNGNTGTAAWYRLLKSDGTTVLWDGSVGTATADLILNSVALSSGATTAITSLTYTLPE